MALIHFRRETGNCKICWSADAATDIGVSGDTNIAKGVVLVSCGRRSTLDLFHANPFKLQH